MGTSFSPAVAVEGPVELDVGGGGEHVDVAAPGEGVFTSPFNHHFEFRLSCKIDLFIKFQLIIM